MKFLLAIVFSLVAYVAMGRFLLGDALQPIALIMIWGGRPGIAFWLVLVYLGAVLGFLIAALLGRLGAKSYVTIPFFIVLAMCFSTALVGACASVWRAKESRAFGPDMEFRNSFLQTLRNAPREEQFFLHGATLKDCVPYAWSYRSMSFYQLPNNVAVNVLPKDWLEMCDIVRDQR